jgi:hypothetical protein
VYSINPLVRFIGLRRFLTKRRIAPTLVSRDRRRKKHLGLFALEATPPAANRACLFPGDFFSPELARPTGYGDIAIGATAVFVASKRVDGGHRRSFMVWQGLGILAVSLGSTAVLRSPHSASMVAMTVLLLSLVPTFLVPLFLIFHIVCIAQARAWKAASGDALK